MPGFIINNIKFEDFKYDTRFCTVFDREEE